PIGFEHAAASEWSSHPAYIDFKLESYLGAPVMVFGDVFGTINFSSPSPRKEPLTSADHQLVELMAEWMGNELQRQIEQAQQQMEVETRNRTVQVEALRRLVKGFTHRFNNPLGYVLGNTVMMRADLEGFSSVLPDDLHKEWSEMLDDIHKGVQRLKEVVNEMQILARLDRPTGEITSIDRVLDDALAIIGVDLTARAKLVRQGNEVPAIYGSRHRLRTVFLNLLRNAVQALPHGEPDEHEVHIAWQAVSSSSIMVTITDSGRGIAEDELKRIFEPFVNGTASRGTAGLGLTLSRAIVMSLGGELSIDSSEGVGTVVTMILPTAPLTQDARELAS
ncbi:MAG: GAF domain-containing sensor histidine kinase, partial [Myxococcota bacterium]